MQTEEQTEEEDVKLRHKNTNEFRKKTAEKEREPSEKKVWISRTATREIKIVLKRTTAIIFFYF